MAFTRGGDNDTESYEQSSMAAFKNEEHKIKPGKKNTHQLNLKYEHEPDQPGDVSVSHRYNSHGHDPILAEC